MNGRFRRMLEPGERILVRSTDGKTTWHLAGALLLLAVVLWVRGIWGADFRGFRFWKATVIFLTFAPLVPAVAWLLTRWKWVITDRRVLKRYGMFSPDIGEMRNETVEAVRLNDTTPRANTLTVHGRKYWWEFAISRSFCRTDILCDLFGARFDDPGLPAKPLADMLEPGETVLHRGSILITDLLPWAILLVGPILLLAVAVWPEALGSWRFIPAIALGPYVVQLADIVAAWRRRGWQTVLTDRRLLRRRPEAPSRCDAVALDSVTEADWDRQHWELIIVSPGRRDDVFCFPWTARRILDALERNDRGEALA